MLRVSIKNCVGIAKDRHILIESTGIIISVQFLHLSSIILPETYAKSNKYGRKESIFSVMIPCFSRRRIYVVAKYITLALRWLDVYHFWFDAGVDVVLGSSVCS